MPSPFTHDQQVLRQYDSQARAYLSSETHARGADLQRLAELAQAEWSQADVLDVGCGGGHVTFALASLVNRVVARDLSSAMVETVLGEAVRRGLDRVEVSHGPVEHLPFADASFDVVVTRYSAHHWQNLAAGVAEMARVLKPGGWGVFIDVISPETPLLDTWLQTWELLRDPSHVRNATASGWGETLAGNGFSVVEEHPARLPLEYAAWVGRMRTPEPLQTAIRALQVQAPDEVRKHFALQDDGSFTLDTLMLVTRKEG